MRAWNGKVLFSNYHAERLFDGLKLLRFKPPGHFNWEFLNAEIHRTLSANNPGQHARVRLMVSRGEGGVTDEPVNSPQFLIECWPIDPYVFNNDGFIIDIFEEARKTLINSPT
jgi:branched-subunit amino acid aminotransferase/4-amino-4-deoxychorismate lyase